MCTRSVPSHCLTCLHSESAAESADAVGKGAFASFLRPPVDSGTIGVTVISWTQLLGRATQTVMRPSRRCEMALWMILHVTFFYSGSFLVRPLTKKKCFEVQHYISCQPGSELSAFPLTSTRELGQPVPNAFAQSFKYAVTDVNLPR